MDAVAVRLNRVKFAPRSPFPNVKPARIVDAEDFDGVLSGMSDGVAMVDADLRWSNGTQASPAALQELLDVIA